MRMKNYLLESLYIHYPFCQHLCNYCDFYKKIPKDKRDIENFEHYLTGSFTAHQNLMEDYGYTWGRLQTLYIGGGTPSLWGRRGSDFLRDMFKRYALSLKAEYEWTLEVNPKGWNEDSVESFIDLGVNRFSLGVQSFNAYYLKHLDRIHTLQDVEDTLFYFQEKKLNFSVDLMLGLPKSKERNVIDELRYILNFGPKHISLYILTVNSRYKYYNDLPSEDYLREEYLKVSEFLRENDYRHYEVSNFAKTGFESKHNLRYWELKSVAALGPSATGFFSEEDVRYKWSAADKKFDIETLSTENKVMERIYLGLRTSKGIKREFLGAGSPVIKAWDERGYLKEKGEKIILTPKGYLMIDSLMNDLFCQKSPL